MIGTSFSERNSRMQVDFWHGALSCINRKVLSSAISIVSGLSRGSRISSIRKNKPL